MGALKNLKRTKCKAKAGTLVTCLTIPAIHLTNAPKTVLEIGGSGYVYALGDRVRLAEAFTYATVDSAPAKFSKMQINVDSGQVTYESVGDAGYGATKNNFKAEIVGGTKDEVRDYVEQIDEFCGHVVLVEDRDTQDWIVMGSINNPVYFKFKGDGGAKAGDKNVAAFEIEDMSGIIYRTYPKALALSIHTD
jgi:hypothetical protein